MASGFFDEGQLARGSLLAHNQGFSKSVVVQRTHSLSQQREQENNDDIADREAKVENQQRNHFIEQPIFRISKPELEMHGENEILPRYRPSRDSMRGLADGLVGMARRSLNSRASRPSTDSNTSSVLSRRVSCSQAPLPSRPAAQGRSSSLDFQYLEYSIRIRPQTHDDPFEGLNVLQMSAMVDCEEYQGMDWKKSRSVHVLDSTTAFDEYLVSFQRI